MKDERAGTDASRRSFAQLAARISAWTTRALLTAILLVAALGFGRQVLLWWRSDAGSPAALGRVPLGGDGFGSLDRLHTLQFGKGPLALQRQTVAGSKEQAQNALRALTRAAASQAQLPRQPANDAERKFVAGLGRLQPVDQQPSGWRLYLLDSGVPTFVGTREALAEPVAPGGTAGQASSGTQAKPAVAPGGQKLGGLPSGGVAPSAFRVVTWGMAIPATDGAWTLYVFSPGGPAIDGVGAKEIPIPPGSERLLSMEVAGGGRIMSFKGCATPDSWTHFYDRWLLANDWRPHGPWRHRGTAWGLRCDRRAAPAGGTLDLELVENQSGQWSGLVLYSAQPQMR
jgi:hypothetical protein